MLGTPLGTAEYATALGKKRYEKQNKLLQCLPKLPDLQSAWLLLQQCAGPRFNYRARTVPPTENTEYASAHDTGMWQTLCALLGKDPFSRRQEHSRRAGGNTTAKAWRPRPAVSGAHRSSSLLGLMGRHLIYDDGEVPGSSREISRRTEEGSA